MEKQEVNLTPTLASIKNKIASIDNLESVSRDTIQNACSDFKNLDCNVCLFWAPRVGKTRATLNMLRFESEKTLICSNTELIRDNWTESLREIGTESVKSKSICYASLKNQNPEWDTIVCDEADLISENYADYISNLNPKRIIFLTGTPTMRFGSVLDTMTSVTKLPTVKWRIGFDKAIKWGILPEPKIVCLGLALRTDKKDQLYYKSKDKSKRNAVMSMSEYFSMSNFERIDRGKKENFLIQCSEFDYHKMIVNDMDYWNSVKKDPMRKVPDVIILNKLKQLGLERKKFFAQKKLRYLNRMVDYFKLQEKRLLIFANSIEQAESVDLENEGFNVIHSKKKNTDALLRFNSSAACRLIAVGMLDRGIEIRNIDASIILQVSASDASITQKASRNLLDDSPFLILPFYKETKDEEWVKSFVSKFDPKYITWIDVSKYTK